MSKSLFRASFKSISGASLAKSQLAPKHRTGLKPMCYNIGHAYGTSQRRRCERYGSDGFNPSKKYSTEHHTTTVI